MKADKALVIRETCKLSSLKGWEKNPRSIKGKDFERLKKQISELKEFKPLLVNSGKYWGDEGTVLGGNMRLKAYGELGIDEAWVSLVDPKDETEALRYALADNDRAGFYDEDLLANLSGEFPEFAWEDFAVDLKPPITLKDLFPNDIEEDEVPAVEEGEPDSKLGEVYELGRHRLMCGDATKLEDVDKLMQGQKADMVFTDPPYNIDFGYKEYNDNKSENVYKEFCEKWFEIFSVYPLIFTPGPRNTHLYPVPKDIGTWLKKGGKTGASVFNLRYCEPILFYGKFKNKRTTDLFEYNTGDFKELNSNRLNSGINITKKDREYAPAKPKALIADIVKSFSEKENLVVDCFGGNGTTLIACQQTNRICYMMELDPRYCDVIRKRYNNYIENNKKQ